MVHSMPQPSASALLLYDADCGFCRWAVAQALRFDRARRLRPLQIQSVDGQGLLAALDPAERLASWHLVTADGCLFSGGAAAAPLLRLLPRGAFLASLFSASPRTTDRVYFWVARHRTDLGRFVSTRARMRANTLVERREQEGQGLPLPENVRPC
jgi:predicted DCC family thiol-disulfide oxidoreductase YuxK